MNKNEILYNIYFFLTEEKKLEVFVEPHPEVISWWENDENYRWVEKELGRCVRQTADAYMDDMRQLEKERAGEGARVMTTLLANVRKQIYRFSMVLSSQESLGVYINRSDAVTALKEMDESYRHIDEMLCANMDASAYLYMRHFVKIAAGEEPERLFAEENTEEADENVVSLAFVREKGEELYRIELYVDHEEVSMMMEGLPKADEWRELHAEYEAVEKKLTEDVWSGICTYMEDVSIWEKEMGRTDANTLTLPGREEKELLYCFSIMLSAEGGINLIVERYDAVSELAAKDEEYRGVEDRFIEDMNAIVFIFQHEFNKMRRGDAA